MTYMVKVLKFVGIALLINSSACAAPVTTSDGDNWPSLYYSQDENKLPPIKPTSNPALGNDENMAAKPATGVSEQIEKWTQEKSGWQAKMGAQKKIYLNAKEKALLTAPEKSRGVWMTAQLQLSRFSQVGDDLSALIKRVDDQPKNSDIVEFRASLTVQRNALIAFLGKELAFLEKTNPND